MDLSKLEPTRALRSLRGEIDQLFDRFVERPLGAMAGHVLPTIDITETDDEVLIKADIPGMDESDLDLSIADNTLTIRGEKKQEIERSGKTHHLLERSYGSFSRSIQLPVPIDADKVRATYKKGVLEIALPKKEQTQTRRVEIRTENTE